MAGAYAQQPDTVRIDYPHVAEEAQPGTPVLLDDPTVALTPNLSIYHQLNWVWGVQPALVENLDSSHESLFKQVEQTLLGKQLVAAGDKVLLMGELATSSGNPPNFLL